jgi:multidrug efflux pump subunit AcrB
MVALISFLLSGKNNVNIAGFFCALSIPLICLISIAILMMIGFSPDKLLLAGIAAGICTAIDAVILCSEKLRKCLNYKSAQAALSSLTGPLLAGGATTIVALIPLSTMENDSKIIASAIAVVTISALVLSLTLLPPLLLWGLNAKKQNRHLKISQFLSVMGKRISHYLCRSLAAVVKFCSCYPLVILSFCVIISVFTVIVLSVKGVDTSGYSSEDSTYAQVEFSGGLHAQEVDRLMAVYSKQLINKPGIKNVETSARTGSGSLLISFDPKQTQANFVRELAREIDIPGGFIFFHENSANDRYWEIFIYGDEDKKCREFAETLADICAGHPLIRERVLNFKQGSNKLILLPDREIFTESKINFYSAASKVRLGVYGPVAYKRIDRNGETDVRVSTNGNGMYQSREGILNLLVSANNNENISYLQIDSLMKKKEKIEPSSIRRDGRRRFASITIITKPMDPRRVKQELNGLFEKLELDSGYSVEFDPEAIKQSENLSASIFSLVFAIIFCYMIIASINESFTVPLFVLSAIPPSLAIPALFLILTGNAYNYAVACAFIVVSGMTVNAAILCVDGLRSKIKTGKEKNSLSIYYALRLKMPALLSTTGTTVAGAIPFLFLTEGANTLIRTLSLVSALGVTCSFFCSITVIPSILSITQKTIPLVRNKNQNLGE